ncbi:ABC transporter substrate-binding protein [Palleronia caenipelagi]|uniref:Amino acid ABC transporter substrate-binding protein n=1 Tax=Palleronia caenipelagi TaxID=2489174 RepID=A0A547Q8Q0_9RHOB|nr:ABC transporter substrate-binding protein [Palleronia caenipelagi]TRD22766.1 amino acid ABC transporter substrate-binding protein [Palleronia caenipelagi]
MSRLICAALLALLPFSATADELKIIRSQLNRGNLLDYERLLNGRDPLEVEDFGAFADNRMVAEHFILQIAPVLGGCDCRVVYEPYDVETPHARTIQQIREGATLTHGVAGFSDDSRYRDDVWLSDPILSADDFYVGLYTHDARAEVLATEDDEDLKNLRYAVGRHWEIDNLVLERNGLTAIPADNWESLVQMIIRGRADVVMQPFQTGPGMSFEEIAIGETFLPIPGVKMKFGQGRHFVVSKTHPDGEAFLAALNQGIKILQQDGLLNEIMTNAGVVNPNAEDLRVISFTE